MEFNIQYGILYSSMILMYFFVLLLKNKNLYLSIKSENFLIVLYILALIFVFGFREANIGTDTQTYLNIYDSVLMHQTVQVDIGFRVLIFISSFFGKKYFLLVCSMAYLLPIAYVTLRLPFKNKLLFIILLFTLFSFQSLGVNIMRQGISLSLMLLSIYFAFYKHNLKLSIMVYVLACSLHFSVILFLPCYIIAKKYSLKLMISILCVSIVFSYLGGVVILFFTNGNSIGFITDKLVNYVVSASDSEYSTGFRLDFLLYNLFYIIIGFICISNAKFKSSKYFHTYKLFLGVFVLLTSLFCFAFYIPYSDRVGVLSWFFIPLICMPIIYHQKYKYSLFTFLMTINVALFIVM